MMRRRAAPAATLAAALLGAVGLGVPAVASADLPQYVTTAAVVRYDRTFPVRPNTLQTVRLALPAMARPGAAMTPCWGFDLTGPGVDLAAASLHTYGWIAGADGVPQDPTTPRAGIEPFRGPDGWYLPEANAVVDLDQLRWGADCRAIGWSMFVGTTSGIASAAEVRRARRTGRMVRIRKPRRTAATRAAPANRVNDGSVTVPLAGTRFLPDHRGLEVVVRLSAGALAGPTTITLHGRVLIPR